MQSWLANFDRASKLLLHVHSEVQIYGILYALNSFKGDLLTFLKTWHQLENNIFKHLIRPTGTNGAKDINGVKRNRGICFAAYVGKEKKLNNLSVLSS